MTFSKQQTRLTCPACKAIALSRLEPSLTRPLLDLGQIYVSCGRCGYRGEMLTADWRDAQTREVVGV